MLPLIVVFLTNIRIRLHIFIPVRTFFRLNHEEFVRLFGRVPQASSLVSLVAVAGCGSRPRHADRMGRSFVARKEIPIRYTGAVSATTFCGRRDTSCTPWRRCGASRATLYFDCIRRYVDQQVDSEGSVPDFKPTALDHPPGRTHYQRFQDYSPQTGRVDSDRL